jgi:hypothetical protein
MCGARAWRSEKASRFLASSSVYHNSPPYLEDVCHHHYASATCRGRLQVVDARVLRARQCLLFQARCCHVCCKINQLPPRLLQIIVQALRERCHRMYIRTSIPRLTCAHCRHSFSNVRDLLRETRHVLPPSELRACLLSWYTLFKVSCSDLTLPECIRNWRVTLLENPTSKNELKKTSKTCLICHS